MGNITKNFSWHEFGSHDGKHIPRIYMNNVRQLAKNLQVLRDYYDKPIKITSGYRSKEHNKRVGGVPKSQHLLGKAADIKVKGKRTDAVYATIAMLIADGKMDKGGIGVYETFVHYDIRGRNARWKGSK